MSRIKVLHIIDSFAVGGAEKLLTGVINGLGDFDHHVIILRGPEVLRREINVPYSFTNLECRSFHSLFGKVKTVHKYIRDQKIQVVHSHLYESNLLARLATPKKTVLINSIHAVSSLASYKRNRIGLYLEKLSYKKRHVLIAVSKTVLNDYNKWIGIKGKYHVLYNYVEDGFFQPVHVNGSFHTPGQLKLIAVGNLRYQKNYPYLLEVFKQLPKNVQLDIYGEGNMRSDLQSKIDAHGLNIRLCGLHGNMDRMLPAYDAFVMSSFFEGQPVSLLEAIASGLPVVLADIAELREVTGGDAIYFDTADPSSLVRIIQNMLAGKYDLRSIAVANHQKANTFAKKRQYLQQLADIYEQSIAGDSK